MPNKKISSGVAHNVPTDLRKTLTADKVARVAWEDITPLARTELKEGKRRPCCWAGCIHH